MKRIWFSLCFVFVVLAASAQVSKTSGRLIVSKDGRDLQYEDGAPFFWLGDTAWELINKLTLNEIKLYLDNRASKGFNVIQLTALSTGDLNKPNRYGEIPLHNLDPLTPNEKYFAILDSVVELSRKRHMFVAIVATWGDKVVKPTGSDGGSVIFDKNNAYPYGKWMGSRYKKFSNVIWIMGGDVPGEKDAVDYRPIWREMARGIGEGCNHQCLITYHPNGERSSSQWMQSEEWMDFNMIQSSHGRRNAPVWEMIKRDRSLTPVIPVLDSEPNYEDHPMSPWPTWKSDSGYFRDYDVRKQLYRAVFSGGCGVTYGHHAIWQFVNERDPVINYAERGWVNALDRPGAFQAGYLRKLMESRPLLGRKPDETIIMEGQGEKGQLIEAFRGDNDNYAMIYIPVGRKISIDPSFLKSKKIAAWWFNPKDGAALNIGTFQQAKHLDFIPPVSGSENDWVLVLDNPAKNYSIPGK